MSVSWDILIPSVWSRTRKLERLLRFLEPQLIDGVGIIVCRDNCEMMIGPKRQWLLDRSQADYVSFIDDDDLVSDKYVELINAALITEPDGVGFRVQYVINGVAQLPMVYSMDYNRPSYVVDMYNSQRVRSCDHLNPVRRDIARRVGFIGHNDEDEWHRVGIENLGILQTEVFLDDVMYFHYYESNDCFWTHRALDDDPVLPKFEFVRYV